MIYCIQVISKVIFFAFKWAYKSCCIKCFRRVDKIIGKETNEISHVWKGVLPGKDFCIDFWKKIWFLEIAFMAQKKEDKKLHVTVPRIWVYNSRNRSELTLVLPVILILSIPPWLICFNLHWCSNLIQITCQYWNIWPRTCVRSVLGMHIARSFLKIVNFKLV